MKKTIIKEVWVILSLLLFSACGDLVSSRILHESSMSDGTKGSSLEYYYWYKGERVNLTVNKEYLNLVVDTALVKPSDVPAFCKEYGLEAETSLDDNGMFKGKIKRGNQQEFDYQLLVDDLRRDYRALFVLPFFDAGRDGFPIGTSQFFFVQLKELSPEGTPFHAKEYDVDALMEEAQRHGVRIVKEVAYMPDWQMLSIEGSAFETAIEAADCFYETGRFEEIDPAFISHVTPDATNDPLFGQQWGLKNTTYPGYDINVEGAWPITTGSGINVAVVDSKIDPSHSDLSSNLSNLSYDVSAGTSCTHPDGDDHGTHVAGIVGAVANNNLQIAGIAYDAEIMRVMITFGYNGSTLSEIASGISWAWQNGADVINCSWSANSKSSLLESSIVSAMTNGRTGRGSVVVFARGNNGDTSTTYPGCSDERIITVGAMSRNGYRSSYSSFGAGLDVVAPGDSILSLSPNNGVRIDSGTSMAAPHVSGVVALMLAANPQLTREEAEKIIQHTAKKISPYNTYSYYPTNYMFDDYTWNQQVGYGLVDASAAVSLAQALTISPNPNGTGMHVEISFSPTNNDHYYTVSGGVFPLMVTASLLPAQINSSYSYYWHLSTAAYPNWVPVMTFADDYNAGFTVPAPSTTSTLYIQCFIYNGSTLVDVPSYALTVTP